MVRHTLATLGPKVQATRMVAEYVERLYAPAASLGRRLAADSLAGAKELAAWKQKVRAQWPAVRVEHVESGGVGDVAHVGDVITITAYVSLGELTATDVDVQVAYGHATEGDALKKGYQIESLGLAQSHDEGRFSFTGSVSLGRSGPFGYTVRVVPKNPLLVTCADLGLIASAS
jgi:starch phosphorylase